MAAKQYVVLNPRGIPKRVGKNRIHILRVTKPRAQKFYEGDTLTAALVPPDTIPAWLAGGFIAEV